LSPELTAALREETPSAPRALRERIAYITATAPPRRRTPSLGQALLYAAPAAAIASLMVAVVVGLGSVIDAGPRPNEQSAGGGDLSGRADTLRSTQTVQEGQAFAFDPAKPAAPLARQRAAPGPSATRAQNVQADLRVLVDDPDRLSAATQRALRTTRRLGGYLVTVQYGTPEPTEGTSSLRVRIPVSRVQAAIVSFSGLGRILSQQTVITDLQQRLDQITRQIRRSKGDKSRIAALRRERRELNRRATFATVDLALTTREPVKTPAAPGRLDRALDDATGILAAELAIGAYILIVASPFLVLLAAGFAGSRAYRRYADQRMLERA
jgi:hypothetical protein